MYLYKDIYVLCSAGGPGARPGHVFVHGYIRIGHVFVQGYIRIMFCWRPWREARSCICTWIYTYMHTDVDVYVFTYLPTYIHAYKYTHIHTYIHACIHVPVHIHVYMHVLYWRETKARSQAPLGTIVGTST